MDLTSSDPTPLGVLFSQALTRTEVTIGCVYASYTVASRPDFTMELGAGLRAVSSSIDIRLQPAALPQARASIHDSWIDPVVAARVSQRFDDRWSGSLTLDYGGFGIGEASDSTWQVIATVRYRVDDRWSAAGGWRALNFDRESDGVPYELDLSGPILGASYRF